MKLLMLVIVIQGHFYQSAERFTDRAACDRRAEEMKTVGSTTCIDADTVIQE